MLQDKLKVVQVNAVGKTLSTGRTTWEMHQYFKSHGIESFIAVAKGGECEEAYAINSKKGVYFDIALSIITGYEGYHSSLQTKRFIKYLETIKPDIVHLRNLHQSYINLGILLKYLEKKNIATVVTMHDFWFMTGKCCSYNVFDCEKWRTGCGKCPAMKADARKRFFDRTEKMWKDKKKWFENIPRLAIIGNSKWTTEKAAQSFLKCADIIDYVYNWIDFSIFYPRETFELRKRLNLENKKIILGVSSFWTLNGTKGFKAFLKLAKVIPETYHILLVGKCEEKFEIPENMTILPSTNSTERLAEYYSLGDVFLNLSESETFGKVSAEAISCGTPLIALNCTANPEIVPEGAGVIIGTTDPKEMLAAINDISSRDKSEYREKCLEHAHSNFDKEKNIEKYLEIYERLLEKRK